MTNRPTGPVAGVPAAKVQLFGLVRDKDGNPRIDDPENLPPQIAAMLTPEERATYGVK